MADTGSGVYQNGRSTGWLYDVVGWLTGFGSTYYHYDAAGHIIQTGSDYSTGDVAKTQVFDGDGQRTKQHSLQHTYQSNGTTTQYFVRSSVLNQVITELNETGQKTRTFVYQGGRVLAW